MSFSTEKIILHRNSSCISSRVYCEDHFTSADTCFKLIIYLNVDTGTFFCSNFCSPFLTNEDQHIFALLGMFFYPTILF